MITYRVALEPLSSFITPLQSDTIFGHLAWAAALTHGDGELAELLRAFRQGKPPFLLSEAFPEGYLPAPALPPPGRSDVVEMARSRHGATTREALRETVEAVKRARRRPFLPAQTFQALAGDLSPRTLYAALMDPPVPPTRCERCQARLYPGGVASVGRASTRAVVTRTAINRLTGAGLQGHLFPHDEEFFAAGARLEIWLAAESVGMAARVHRWLTVVEQGGFGKRKSAGQGRFRLGPLERAETPSSPDANAFVTLSSYVPRHGDPTVGNWRAIIKRGKLGGPWATGDNVWKKPLLMFAPGSVFRVEGNPADFYGGLVAGPASRSSLTST